MAVAFQKSKALGSLDLTPLIDVVFQLIIFFLVATEFDSEDRELDVTLPKASEARPLTAQPEEVFVNIDEDGNYFMAGKTRTLDEVESLLREAKVNNPLSQSVILRADKAVALDHVVAVMNLCNKVGMADYTLTTEGEEP
jgi:biopolymer transport protein ExbD